jgi:hypothetical protein
MLPVTVVPAKVWEVGDERRKNSFPPPDLGSAQSKVKKYFGAWGRGEADTVGAFGEGDGALHTGGALENADSLGGHLQRGKSGGRREQVRGAADIAIIILSPKGGGGKGEVGTGCSQKAYTLQGAADALQLGARKRASGGGGLCFWAWTPC